MNAPTGEVHVVTGAFGYSGRYIAQRLLDAGHQVRTLTNSPDRRNPFGGRVTASPFHFEDPAKLEAALSGARVLYNTYWVRFNHQGFDHRTAVRNTRILFRAAKAAGVERIVHTSITNPSTRSRLEYFSGKGELEEDLRALGVSHAILRPTVLFGREDILINNIAWVLRHFPIFGVFGNGRYRLQPIYVEDFADLAVRQGVERDDAVIDAIGPETFSFRGLVEVIGDTIGCRRPMMEIPAGLGYLVSKGVGALMKDVLLTREEIEGLMADLLYTDSPPAGETKLTAWMEANRGQLGLRYASELARRRDLKKAYGAL